MLNNRFLRDRGIPGFSLHFLKELSVHWENAIKVWYYEKWVRRHASFPPRQSVKKYHFSLCIVLVRGLAFVWSFTIFMTFCHFDKWSLVLQSYHFILFLRCKFIHDQNIYYTQIVKTLFCLLRNSLIKQTETLSNTIVWPHEWESLKTNASVSYL